jgi:ADP-heptose:LPS heptosyltransferase
MRLLSARNPVVLYCNGIGDHILAVPALRGLAHLFPQRLTLVCALGARRFFFGDIRFGSVFETKFEAIRGGRRWFDADAVAAATRGCDLLISLNPWHSKSVDRLLTLLGPRFSLGFFEPFEANLPLDYRKHSAELSFDVARFLRPALRIEDFASPLTLPAGARRWAGSVRRHIPRGLKMLAVHADTKREKMWPVRRMRRVIDEFLERHEEFVAFEVGEKPLRRNGSRHGERFVPSHGLPLPFALGLVAEADLFLGVDSCMLHAADLFRVPGVGLFGPTSSREWGFRFAPHRHVEFGELTGGAAETQVLDALESLVAGPLSDRLLVPPLVVPVIRHIP